MSTVVQPPSPTVVTHPTELQTFWSRRAWLAYHGFGLAILRAGALTNTNALKARARGQSLSEQQRAVRAARVARHAEQIDPGPWKILAQRGVDAARAAGARYAEVRLTRTVRHSYDPPQAGGLGGRLSCDEEVVGISARALVGGYWGSSIGLELTPDSVVQLAQDAVGQAKESALGPAWQTELGTIPVATGTWTTPIEIDPFTIAIEEKEDLFRYWGVCCGEEGLIFGPQNFPYGWLAFVREERVTATSEGSLFTQTRYETGGPMTIGPNRNVDTLAPLPAGTGIYVRDLAPRGAGWEYVLKANVAEQFRSGRLTQEVVAAASIPQKPAALGRYTLVCDGATMAALTESTLGLATQLDRALGYEANANGTSFLTDDPLSDVGHATVTSPLLTLTADRTAPGELATVQWDDEGVAAATPYPLIQDGVLVDFQTMREQAAWLASYYQRKGLPVQSHGCAVASAHGLPLQQTPNLVLKPGTHVRTEDVSVAELVANVKDGILVEQGWVSELDSQTSTGILRVWDGMPGGMREIKNGQLGKRLMHGAVLFDSRQLWKEVLAVGGAQTQGRVWQTGFVSSNPGDVDWALWELYPRQRRLKGEPPQVASHSTHAIAATIANQPLISPERKA